MTSFQCGGGEGREGIDLRREAGTEPAAVRACPMPRADSFILFGMFHPAPA